MTRSVCWSIRGASCCCSPAATGPCRRPGRSASPWASPSRWRGAAACRRASSGCWISPTTCAAWDSIGTSTWPWRSLFCCNQVSGRFGLAWIGTALELFILQIRRIWKSRRRCERARRRLCTHYSPTLWVITRRRRPSSGSCCWGYPNCRERVRWVGGVLDYPRFLN